RNLHSFPTRRSSDLFSVRRRSILRSQSNALLPLDVAGASDIALPVDPVIQRRVELNGRDAGCKYRSMVARRGVCLAAFACILQIAGCAVDDGGPGGRIRIRLSGYTGNPAETDLVSALVAEFNRSQGGGRAVYVP